MLLPSFVELACELTAGLRFIINHFDLGEGKKQRESCHCNFWDCWSLSKEYKWAFSIPYFPRQFFV